MPTRLEVPKGGLPLHIGDGITWQEIDCKAIPARITPSLLTVAESIRVTADYQAIFGRGGFTPVTQEELEDRAIRTKKRAARLAYENCEELPYAANFVLVESKENQA